MFIADHPSFVTPPRARRAPLIVALGIAGLFLTGCAQMPTGPTVAVMPGQNKPFDVFVQDDQVCRTWAAQSIGLAGNDAAAQTLLASTITGAAIGAVAGAMIGGNHPGEGAAFGTLMGAAAGTEQSNATVWHAQRRYDIAYQQCMYSKGNLVPTYGAYRRSAPPPPPPPAQK